jgi:hypothetical protein
VDVDNVVVGKVEEEVELGGEDTDAVLVFDGHDVQAPIVKHEDIADC